MKNANNPKECPVTAIRALLTECKVPSIRALKRAGMAASTPFRWEKEGTKPKEGQVERLRLAILELADESKTLPEKHRKELIALSANKSVAQPETARSCPRQILKRIQSDMRELDSVLASQSAVQ